MGKAKENTQMRLNTHSCDGRGRNGPGGWGGARLFHALAVDLPLWASVCSRVKREVCGELIFQL